ncbi:MAG: M1 family aminopeptidase [Archangium sp.]
MIGALIGFELVRRLKMFSTYVYGVVLFGIGGLVLAQNAGLMKDVSAGAGSERVFANGPHSLFANQTLLALFALFMVAAVFGQAASQDFTTGMWPLIFTRNVKKLPYLAGRFLGAWLFSGLLFLAIPAGQLIVALVASVAKPGPAIGPHHLSFYLWPWLVAVLPMLFVAGAVFFALAALTRQMAPVYVGMVVLVLGYFALSAAMGDVQNRTIGAIADPFGFITFDVVTKYWTPAERNRDLVPLWGLYLVNKVVWLAFAGALLSLTVNRFRTTIDESRGGPGKRDEEAEAKNVNAPLPKATIAPTAATWWGATLDAGWMHFKDVLLSPVYWAFVAAGLFFTVTALLVTKDLFGTATLPLTWQVLEFSGGVFRFFTLITVTFYAGELVWKERDASLADIIDATRAPSWVGFVSKLVAIVLVVASLQFVAAGAALVGQLSRGFTQIDWSLYASELIGFGFLRSIILASLALTLQYVINHKYLAHGAMVAYFGSRIALGMIGVEEPLVSFNSEPQVIWSDLNGYGHWIPVVMVFRTYWYAITGLLLVLAFALMSRGRESSLKQRRALAPQRITGPWRAFTALCVLVAVAAGGRIFEREHLAHKFKTAKDEERQQAEYEKKWKAWETKDTPRITDADVKFDVFPYATPPQMKVTGSWTFTNKTANAIPSVLVSWDETAQRESLSVAGATTPIDGALDEGLAVFKLDPPLAPGESRKLDFVLNFVSEPFKHGPKRHDIVGNGTFFNNFALPGLGYVENAELVEDGVRAKYDLKPKERMLDRDDPKGLVRNYIRADSDFVGFRATVSTASDQIGIAPGTLTKEWTEGDRRFFRYEMDQPILDFFSVLSARYTVKEDVWNDVKLQIFYDAKHPWNVDRMMGGMKDALAYCSENFGPYQHHQARILEFPRYETFAQSFPNTIPYSEAIGFIARVRDDSPEDLDYPYYVTAHEIAHQWWAHQVVGGDVQGATVTSETMAQYSALMVMKKKYGPEKMRRFLKYELDHYLIGRVVERKKELPLSRVENQGYIHYQKGSLVMYWLQDVVGEDVVNRALKKYVAATKFRGPPYTNSTELLKFLREEVPSEHHALIDDLFDKIIVYENRAISASARKNADLYDVTIKVKVVKYANDEKGEQTELDFEDVMEIGGVDADGNAVCTEKRKIKKGERDLTFTCATLPVRAGVDPLNKLIDRNPDDNTEPVSTSE